MNARQTSMNFSDGTSQADRFPEALREGYIHVDEMRFEDLLSLGVDYAGMLKYFDLNNQADQNWSSFFEADTLVIFAKILALDLKKIESVFLDDFSNAAPSANDLAAVPNYQLALKIDYWFKALEVIESEVGQKLVLIIRGVIEDKLKKQLQALEGFFKKTFIKKNFHPVWSKKQSKEGSSEGDESSPRKDQSGDQHFLRSNFSAFYNAAMLIQESTRKLLPEAFESQIHNPAIGMYVTFIRLFQKVQQRLNRFTGRHLDFYYRDILKIQPHKLIPAQAFLKFDTDTADREVLIEAGTEFVAGIDADNNDIIYTADSDLLVTGARVESLYTLFFECDPKTFPEQYLGYVSAAKINEIPVTQDNASDNDSEMPAWPIFGAPRSASEKRAFNDAELGFALASPVLFLKEGQRLIDFTFKIGPLNSKDSQDFGDYLTTQIDKIRSNERSDNWKYGAANLKSSRADIFFKIFRQMFTIELTTENGWYEVEDYLPLSRIIDDKYEVDSLNIQIQLSFKDPAIMPYAAEIHGDGYDTDQPIVRFTINPNAYLFPHSLLKKFVIKEIEIDVNVKGVKEVVVHNHLGQLDPDSPFYPFGPLPAIGSYFIIGNQEIAGKQLTCFEMELEWAGLPLEKDGFKDYYGAYEQDYDDHVFEAGLTVLSGGKWQPSAESDQPRAKLFESGPAGVAKSSRLSCQGVVKLMRPMEEVVPPVEFGYHPSQKDGFFKFTLTAPASAFGHKDYPLKLTEILTENAKLKKLRLHKPMPNPPYTPQIDSLSINYGAVVKLNLEKRGSSEESLHRNKIYHIHPLGVEYLAPQTDTEITMAPAYKSAGNLFIGLFPRVISGILTLLFHLRENSSLKADTGQSALTWYYLSENCWKPLETKHVLSDSTNGFLSSGIVTLNIPPHQPGTNTAMPDDQFWLRVSLDQHPELPCSVYAIHSQALAVTHQKRDSSQDQIALKLPSGTITDSRVSIPGIDRIVQITDSFGGRPPEEEDQFKTRISERLRHKNRAIDPWDFERLILNHFPTIHKVKCFPNMVDNSRNWTRPGHLLIVVIPFPADASSANMKPTVNGMLLNEIKEYVNGLSSTFATIKVRNPAYEKIQIRCAVQFRRGKGSGYYLKELNQALVDFLSPWNETGYTATFGWRVRRYDIKAYIRNLDYINFVTDFSMLRVAEDDMGCYSLFDTVGRHRQVKEIYPLCPWGIAIPFQQHFIEVLEKAEAVQPVKTGINELKIGSNFIIPGAQSHGSEK